MLHSDLVRKSWRLSRKSRHFEQQQILPLGFGLDANSISGETFFKTVVAETQATIIIARF
jgi:hypothetical protein